MKVPIFSWKYFTRDKEKALPKRTNFALLIQGGLIVDLSNEFLPCLLQSSHQTCNILAPDTKTN